MVFNVQKIACGHLRDAACTTSMKVYKNCFHYCSKKLVTYNWESIERKETEKISNFEVKKYARGAL